MSVTVSRLCVWDSSPSSFSDSESCRDSLVLLRLPALRMDDSEPPFFTRKLRAPLIWSRREPPMRIFRMGAGEDGSGGRSSTLFVTTDRAAGGGAATRAAPSSPWASCPFFSSQVVSDFSVWLLLLSESCPSSSSRMPAKLIFLS